MAEKAKNPEEPKIGKLEKYQIKEQIKKIVISFFNHWDNEKIFVDKDSLNHITTNDFRELFRSIKSNAIIEKDKQLKLMCADNSGKLRIHKFY